MQRTATSKPKRTLNGTIKYGSIRNMLERRVVGQTAEGGSIQQHT